MSRRRSPRAARRPRSPVIADPEPLWYKDAVIYELHVRAFADSNGDGIGDFRGLTKRLDYLQDLGVTAVWLLPFYPSSLRDDGYDIADYTDVHPHYGTLRDFKAFLRAAHDRGIRVITELVLNHTSDRHPWFQRARRAGPGTPAGDFYVWSETPERYREARIIFKDFEHSNWSWDPVARAYYWHRFYAHQPDLNYDNPAVHQAMLDVLDFWLEMGVDGLRMDAVPYLYEREGTNCENLPETHAFLKAVRRHVDQRFPNRLLLAEANQWPEDAVAYFGDGDECNMAFHFPLMPRMFMAIRMEDRFPIIDILTQTPAIAEGAQWALFLRNHDELTLEMVTDEERDYMYRVYAYDPQARINLGIRRRLAPLFGNHRRSIELMNGLLLSLPGTPVLYYGDEIGMGDNIYLGDRNGVRTPMQWSADRNAGFSRANPQRLYLPINIDPEYHYEAVNVEAQRNNSRSLFWWMKRLIALRKQYRAFGRGTLEFLSPDNPKVLAFVRRHGDERILVVANLSRFAQYVELDLSAYQGFQPIEVFGRTAFPKIGELPYLLTLAPHGFYWFALERPQPGEVVVPEAEWPRIEVAGHWTDVWTVPKARAALEGILPRYLRARRWFGGKTRGVKSAGLTDVVPMPADRPLALISLVTVEYREGDPETYALPLTFALGDEAERLRRDAPHAIVGKLRVNSPAGVEDGLLVDALWNPGVAQALFQAIIRRRRFRGQRGTVVGWSARAPRRRREGQEAAPLEPHISGAGQSNTSIVLGERFILKLLRKVDEGVSPDLSIHRFLSERPAGFRHVAPLAGALEYQREHGKPSTLAMLNCFVPNEGDAWRYTVDHVADSRFPRHRCPTSRASGRPRGSPPRSARTSSRPVSSASAPPRCTWRWRRTRRIRTSRPSPSRPCTSARSISRCATRPDRPFKRSAGPSGPCRSRFATTPAACSNGRRRCWSGWPPSGRDRSRRCGSACTATITWASCSIPARTSSSSTSRASPAARCRSGWSNARRCATRPGCCDPCTTRRSRCSPSRSRPAWCGPKTWPRSAGGRCSGPDGRARPSSMPISAPPARARSCPRRTTS
jgi:maltose alpha-D-glucosyltransferase/alpha-amylase